MLNHIIFFCLFCCGILLIYRGTLEDEDFKIFSGMVIDKKLEPVGEYKSGAGKYALTFQVENMSEKFGIFAGPDSLSIVNGLMDKIHLNERYTFYLDPTVMRASGINLGIRKITQNKTVVYDENGNKQFMIGIVVSILILVFWYFYSRKK